MPEWFNVAELVKIGVEDEKTGVAFYTAVAEKVQSDKLKALFADLADQEKHHQERFEKMLEELGGVRTSQEEYPGEYMEYLRTLTDERAFPDEDAAVAKAEQCSSDAQAVDLASRFERDTLILMNEMRGLVPEMDRAIVQELAREEQQHLVQLAEARKLL